MSSVSERWGSCCVGAHSIAHWPGAQADMDKTLLSILWVSPLCNDTKKPIFAATAVVDAITGKRPTSCGLHRLSSIFHFNPLHKLSHNLHYDFKHEYLRSRAYICLSLSSPSGDLSIKSWTIEIHVLTSWIPASKNFFELQMSFRKNQTFQK